MVDVSIKCADPLEKDAVKRRESLDARRSDSR